jgi:hypothetical protein
MFPILLPERIRYRYSRGVSTLGFSDLLRPGCRVAIADGVGSPTSSFEALSRAAAAAGGVNLVLGWTPAPLDGLDLAAFASVRTLMGGYALRAPIDRGEVRYAVVRLGASPAVLHGALLPDVLVASVARRVDGFGLLTEVAWMRAAIDDGAMVAGVERPSVPGLDAGPPIDSTRIVLIGSSMAPPAAVEWGTFGPVHAEIAQRLVPWIPAGSRLQYGPGAVGSAVVQALEVPVVIDTGIVTDAVMDLDHRGLLLGRPLAPYVAGGPDFYQWCQGRVDVDRVERTHDSSRLSGAPPLVAVNTALQVDVDGQVNVEAVGGSAVGGIGGQPDYGAAAARSVGGLSVVALPTTQGGHPTLVERLSAPTTTPSHDVDVLATESGVADLRGLDRTERRRAIAALWG